MTKREAEVIELICEGKSNKEIAAALFISLQTVKDHIYSVFKKTDVKSRIQLANLIQEYLSKDKLTQLPKKESGQAESKEII